MGFDKQPTPKSKFYVLVVLIMAQELIDITGNEYGFLKVVGFSHIGVRRRSYWKCECQRCGKIIILRKDSFAYPYSRQKSCGCWHTEESSARAKNNKDEVSGKFKKSSVKNNI